MIYPHAHHYYYSLLPQHNQSLTSTTKVIHSAAAIYDILLQPIIYTHKVTSYSNINPTASYCYYSITNSNRGRRGNIHTAVSTIYYYYYYYKYIGHIYIYITLFFGIKSIGSNDNYIYTITTIDESNPIQ